MTIYSYPSYSVVLIVVFTYLWSVRLMLFCSLHFLHVFTPAHSQVAFFVTVNLCLHFFCFAVGPAIFTVTVSWIVVMSSRTLTAFPARVTVPEPAAISSRHSVRSDWLTKSMLTFTMFLSDEVHLYLVVMSLPSLSVTMTFFVSPGFMVTVPHFWT